MFQVLPLLIHSPNQCTLYCSPLAYSMLADLVHHVRHELSTELISRTVRLYTQHLHDSSFAPNLQTMCAKLLLNLIECIVNNKADKMECILKRL